MKAMVLHEIGGPVVLEEREVRKPGIGEALVKTRAAGVGLTVAILKATPELVTELPRIPGHEIAGDVVEVGEGVANVKPGDRVTCHFYLTCGHCRFCRMGKETLCDHWQGYVGMACDGGYAEYVTLPARNLIPIPEGVSYPDAAIAADAICTPLHACREEGRVGPGDDVLIVGAAGGVGIHGVQMAKLCGGRVIAADITEEKLALARRHGAGETILSGRQSIPEEVLRLTDGKGVDCAIDFVASKVTLEACVASLGKMGRLVIIGFHPAHVFGQSPKFVVDPADVLGKMLEIHGSRYVNMAELGETLEIVRQGKIKPVITEVIPLEEIEGVHRRLLNREIAGRVVVAL
ncbi:MAG: alcohol dehydrogenase catalytic domain-containing protein [Candidatus Tectomicrobia bacterium]|nr:alcohol dehydrogenase catalytic domain-containing protein [Candidatus Tectomicrobia bacterium]